MLIQHRKAKVGTAEMETESGAKPVKIFWSGCGMMSPSS
jgi:hypothetical protein